MADPSCEPVARGGDVQVERAFDQGVVQRVDRKRRGRLAGGDVTDTGTRSRAGSLERRETVSGSAVGVLRVTVPVVAPLPPASFTSAPATWSVRVGASSSVTVSGCDAPVNPPAVGADRRRLRPVDDHVAHGATRNEADDCPAGIVTDAGTVAAEGSLLESVTTSGEAVSELRDTVASTELPPPSPTVAADSVRPSDAGRAIAWLSASALFDSFNSKQGVGRIDFHDQPVVARAERRELDAFGPCHDLRRRQRGGDR